jgi:HAMP domain-containing protein
MGEFGAVSVVSGLVRNITMTMPLQIEALYNEYNMVGAFALASVLSLLAVATLIIKTLVEGRTGIGADEAQQPRLVAGGQQRGHRAAGGGRHFLFRDRHAARPADSQQKVRVQLAGANARQEITRLAEDTLTYARVLADRPPLGRLLSEPGREGLVPFLRRFCETSGLDACVVFDGAQVVAASGKDLPWPSIFAVSREQGERFMAVPTGTQFSVIGAVAKLPGQYSSFSVMVVHLLDDAVAATLSAHSGLPVRLINYRAFNALPDDEFTSLHSQAMTDGRFAMQRIDSLGLYASSFPVFSSSGEGIALIETRASARESDQSVSELVWRLIITAFVFAVLALVAGVLLGWRVTRPAEALTDAAVRLGQGDFATSIPTAGPAEIGQLAAHDDDMRRNLVELNSELRHREAEAQWCSRPWSRVCMPSTRNATSAT